MPFVQQKQQQKRVPSVSVVWKDRVVTPLGYSLQHIWRKTQSGDGVNILKIHPVTMRAACLRFPNIRLRINARGLSLPPSPV